MKKNKFKDKFIEQFKIFPNISAACEKVGVSRNTVYRWTKEDPEFGEDLLNAEKIGVESINDLAESQLVQKINKGDMKAITHWLDNHKMYYIKPRSKTYLLKAFNNEKKEDNIVAKILRRAGLLGEGDLT